MVYWDIKFVKIHMIQLLKNKNIALTILMFLHLIGCNTNRRENILPFINKPDFTPEWIKEDDKAYDSIHQIPAFRFQNQDGQWVTENTIEGKIYVANFIFTRCASICPIMTNNMLAIQKRFKDDADVVLLSHSVTPDLDNVAILKKYAINKGIISGKWHLLTGRQEDIYRIAKKEYFAGDTIGFYQANDAFLHTENFILVDKKRRIRGVYNGTLALEMDRLILDIETLKMEDD